MNSQEQLEWEAILASIPVGQTKLHVAAEKNAVEFAKFLLEEGADPNAKTPSGLTPLFWARTKEMVKTLVQYGADVNVTSTGGYTPLFASIRDNQRLITSVIKALVECGADVNKTGNVFTPLMAAVDVSDVAAVEFLLSQGAKANPNVSVTVMHLAARRANQHMVKTLIQSGFPVDERDDKGETPLFVAMERHLETHKIQPKPAFEPIKVIGLLLQAGAYPWPKDNYGQTPIPEETIFNMPEVRAMRDLAALIWKQKRKKR